MSRAGANATVVVLAGATMVLRSGCRGHASVCRFMQPPPATRFQRRKEDDGASDSFNTAARTPFARRVAQGQVAQRRARRPSTPHAKRRWSEHPGVRAASTEDSPPPRQATDRQPAAQHGHAGPASPRRYPARSESRQQSTRSNSRSAWARRPSGSAGRCRMQSAVRARIVRHMDSRASTSRPTVFVSSAYGGGSRGLGPTSSTSSRRLPPARRPRSDRG